MSSCCTDLVLATAATVSSHVQWSTHPRKQHSTAFSPPPLSQCSLRLMGHVGKHAEYSWALKFLILSNLGMAMSLW